MASDADDRPPGRRALPPLLWDVLVALVIVGVVLGTLFAYTQVWPPMVVIESASMMHAEESQLGVVDTGDIVLVQRAPNRGDVVTYVEGRATGYATYGDYGDVVIFNVPDQGGSPIIHRAVLFLVWNATVTGYDAPDLALLDPQEWEGTHAGLARARSPYGLTGLLRIFGAGFRGDLTLEVDLSDLATRARYDGYVTLGDGNAYASPLDRARPDRWLIPHTAEAVIGKARGELPWFGLLKLTLLPTPNCCPAGWGDPRAPANSWDGLLVALVVLVVSPFLIDLGWIYLKRFLRRPAEVSPAGDEPLTASSEATEPPDELPPPPPDEGPEVR